MYIISVGFARGRGWRHTADIQTAFRDNPDPEKEVEINVAMMRRVVRAVKSLSSKFQFFVYPGGTRVISVPRL
jgi:hypothetical protein